MLKKNYIVNRKFLNNLNDEIIIVFNHEPSYGLKLLDRDCKGCKRGTTEKPVTTWNNKKFILPYK